MQNYRLKTQMEEQYTLQNLDLNFRKELSEKVGGRSLLNCIQCGVCSSGCTVSEYIDLQPHRMVASCLLGLKDLVLNSNAIWICSLCHKCTERCPKHVDYSFLLAVLRNLSVEAGNVPTAYIQVLKNMYETGLAVPFTAESVEKRREKIGIPKIPKPGVAQIKRLIEMTEMDYLLNEEEKED